MPLHKRRLSRAQKQHTVRNLLHGPHPLHRRNIDRRLQELDPFLTPRRHRRCNDPWADTIDSDAVFRVVNRVAARHPYYR